ncbi:hypothetical protein D9611_002979 [Ephemerocybe angulata]|uniref:MFS general substrate transporter n=1 Tax=Ephemerocybe angulata TaxID=980116 RepID=A0A8H5FI61_9AGAR|nr:hypothetical protein D9611_002979 [Tulosesus angulatus]
MTNSKTPAIYSLPRLTTLLTSLLVALASGTNYVYSAYAPQMGARLNITHTALNIVALAGNFGVYTTGPIWGRIVDTRGPRILLCSAFVFLLGGYMGIRYLYDRGLEKGQDSLGLLGFCALVVFSYLTGAGGNGGLTSSVNSTAKSFPDQMRGITTGLVISGFGLSAFLFSTISRSFFAGNTSSFLFLLAVGTASPMILGFFLIKPIPLPPHEKRPHSHEPVPERAESGILERNDSRSPLLSGRGDEDDDEEDDSAPPSPRGYVAEAGLSPDHRRRERDVELSPQRHLRSLPEDVERPTHTRDMSRGAALAHDVLPNIYGMKLWKSSDFYLLFSILSLLSGTGLMYINNVGSMSQALYAFKNPKYDPVEAARWQSTQVSSISLMNCAGRILIGVISDFGKNRFDIPRSYCLVLVSLACFISQIVTARVDHVTDLWLASSVLGLGYGAVFSLLPTVCMEWFGMTHFSENWGYLSMSPMIAGNLFSLVFGWNLDRNDDPAKGKVVARMVPLPGTEIRCSKGVDCYVDSVYMTIGATFLALGLSVWAGFRDRRKVRNAMIKREMLRRGEADDY